jgi:hypothetical protein
LSVKINKMIKPNMVFAIVRAIIRLMYICLQYKLK